jgi:hypothetical protein
MHLDRRLTWAKHIKTERNQLNLKTKQMHWLLVRKSTLSIELGTASNFNIETLQRFQSKTESILVHKTTTGSMKIYK